ncbi:MAG: c-type cytochrome [Gaiellaceae bacterium]
MKRAGLLIALPLLLLAAGCGYEGTVSATPQTVIGKVAAPPAQPVTKLKGDPVAGKKVFMSAGCGGCHTLKDAGTTGTVGPNLDEKKPPLAKALLRVTYGKSPMPSFKGQLTEQQIADVAAYVVQATSG